MDEAELTIETGNEIKFPYLSAEASIVLKGKMAKSADGWAVINETQMADGSKSVTKAHLKEGELAQLTVLQKEWGSHDDLLGDDGTIERLEVAPDGTAAKLTHFTHEPSTADSPFRGFTTQELEVTPNHVLLAGREWSGHPSGKFFAQGLKHEVERSVKLIETWARATASASSN